MERPNWNNKHYLHNTRIEAVMHGQKRYTSKKLCKKGHQTRYANSDACVICSQENTKAKHAELNRPSRMIEIDHLMEQREEDLLMDKYYYMEI